MRIDEKIVTLEGNVEICAWPKGLIEEYLKIEPSLQTAIAMAKKNSLPCHVQKMHNLTTNVGRQFVARRLSGQETVGITYMAFGSGATAPAIGDTTLETEVVRKPVTECYQGDQYVYTSVFLLANECSFHLKEGAIFGGASASGVSNSGIMLCRFAMDEDNTLTSYDLTVQHTGEMK